MYVYQVHRCNNDTDKFVIHDQIRSTIKLGEICYDTFDLAVLENCKDEEEKSLMDERAPADVRNALCLQQR